MSDIEKAQDEEEIITEDQHDNDREEVETVDWKAEALKNKAIADRLKKKLSNQPITQPKQEHEDEVVKKVNHLSMLEEKRQFGYEHGLSPEETDHAFRFANGKPTKETLQDSFFMGGLESLRAKKRLESNIHSPSSRSTVFADKSFSDLSDDERKKTFEARMKRK